MNTDRAYLLGLLVGGGNLGVSSLSISFPYKKWGQLGLHPVRGGNIAKDFLTKVQPLFRNEYKMDVSYKIEPNWRIYSSSLTDDLVNDLKEYGLPINGDIRDTADIGQIEKKFNSGCKRAFIAGLADTVGSLAASHRRFSNQYQIISFEFKGRNFKLVASISRILEELGCAPDQILWNHPNQHSGSDKYYRSWKKGFKIRVPIDDYIAKGSFLFQTKKSSATENIELQEGHKFSVKNKRKRFTMEGAKTIHIDENSTWLPEYLRGYHFIHNQHFAVVLGAAKESPELISELENLEKHVNPFTILTKGSRDEIEAIVQSDKLLKDREYENKKFDIDALIALYKKNPNGLIFGTKEKGYPVNQVLQGMAYVIGATLVYKVKGKRVVGSFIAVLE